MTSNGRKTAPVFIVVALILAILAALYFNAGYLHRERLEDIAKNQGDDEFSQVLQAEADSYAHANRNQQRIILGVGAVIVLVTAIWWASGLKSERR